MGLTDRLSMYRELEERRGGRPLLVYVTSRRSPAEWAAGQIAADVVPELLIQLEALPRTAEELDLFLVSQGGDPNVAWRIVSLIRERVKRFSVLVPDAAFSAATLIALGADEIVMHAYGNLGPVDPQIIGSVHASFGTEDLAAFLDFCRDRIGVATPADMLEAFRWFCSEVGTIPVGVAARSSHLSITLGERLLRLHMKGDSGGEARAIAEALNKNFPHHGYPVSRREARDLGLKVVCPDRDTGNLLRRIWVDLEQEMAIRKPFDPLAILTRSPECSPLFASAEIVEIPPVPFSIVYSLMESRRVAARNIAEGKILAVRSPDLELQMTVQAERPCWRNVDLLS